MQWSRRLGANLNQPSGDDGYQAQPASYEGTYSLSSLTLTCNKAKTTPQLNRELRVSHAALLHCLHTSPPQQKQNKTYTLHLHHFFLAPLPTPPALPFLAPLPLSAGLSAGRLPVVELTILAGPKKDSSRPAPAAAGGGCGLLAGPCPADTRSHTQQCDALPPGHRQGAPAAAARHPVTGTATAACPTRTLRAFALGRAHALDGLADAVLGKRLFVHQELDQALCASRDSGAAGSSKDLFVHQERDQPHGASRGKRCCWWVIQKRRREQLGQGWACAAQCQGENLDRWAKETGLESAACTAPLHSGWARQASLVSLLAHDLPASGADHFSCGIWSPLSTSGSAQGRRWWQGQWFGWGAQTVEQSPGCRQAAVLEEPREVGAPPTGGAHPSRRTIEEPARLLVGEGVGDLQAAQLDRACSAAAAYSTPAPTSQHASHLHTCWQPMSALPHPPPSASLADFEVVCAYTQCPRQRHLKKSHTAPTVYFCGSSVSRIFSMLPCFWISCKWKREQCAGDSETSFYAPAAGRLCAGTTSTPTRNRAEERCHSGSPGWHARPPQAQGNPTVPTGCRQRGPGAALPHTCQAPPCAMEHAHAPTCSARTGPMPPILPV